MSTLGFRKRLREVISCHTATVMSLMPCESNVLLIMSPSVAPCGREVPMDEVFK